MDKPECAEKLTKILPDVYVRQDWMPLFQERDSDNRTLLALLSSSISQVEQHLGDDPELMIPDKSKLLLPLSRCPPAAVKVVILGQLPISDKNKATGFALSYPPKMFIDKDAGRKGKNWDAPSLALLHTVLVEAGYLERGATYDGCHEVWADRGVLLLNAALTYDYYGLHFLMWQDFVSQLLLLVGKHSKQKPIFFLCWGGNAKAVSELLLPKLKVWGDKAAAFGKLTVQKIDVGDHSTELDGSVQWVIYTGDYPTYPREGSGNGFIEQATNQFKAIKKCYPDLFKLPKLPKEEPL